MDAQTRTISRLQRSAERRGQHLLGVLDKNEALQHEVQKLSDALVRCYFVGDDEVKEIVRRKIPTHLRKVLAKQSTSE